MASRKDALITGIPYVSASKRTCCLYLWLARYYRDSDLIHALEVERNKAINATVAKASFWQQ